MTAWNASESGHRGDWRERETFRFPELAFWIHSMDGLPVFFFFDVLE
jgi:hypothetical protein